MPATPRTISIVQLYVRRDQMMANLRSIRSFDASVGMLSPEDRARYFGEPEQADANTRPLTTEQTKTLRTIWEMCRANGGSTRLSREPAALVNRGLVKRCEGAGLVRWHMTAEGTAQAEQAEQARVATRASRVTVLAAALVSAAACDAAPVDSFTAPPAAGITSAASTDAPPAEPSTTSDETSDADATSTGTGSTTSEPSTTTAAVDATSTSGGDDTTGEPDTTTTGADTTTADPSTGEASTSTGDDTTTAGDASTTGEGTSTGEPPLELPPECLSYVPLTDANRNVAFGIYGPKTCDAQLAPGWYRFMGAAGSRMPTTPPPIFSCGAHAPGWMSGGPHPTVADGIVERTACYHWDNDGDGPLPDKPCWVSMPMQVRDCGEFVVYHLSPSAACMTRFCGEV